MSILAELKQRFAVALQALGVESGEWLDMIRRSQDPKFGDYQANFAMALSKKLNKPARDVATAVIEHLSIDDLCEKPEVAGPGFINLKLRSDWLGNRLQKAAADSRLGVAPVAAAKRYLIDYSAPNVAKPMHVGHIRSTVIGDSICRVLRFLGHEAISDNHIGDWGTQFGMIIYGYRNFVDAAAYRSSPVLELARLYKLVRRIMDHLGAQRRGPALETAIAQQQALLAAEQEKKLKGNKNVALAETNLQELREEQRDVQAKLAANQADAAFVALVAAHAGIEQAVLGETAKLHAGDAENLRLWREFMPACLEEIERIYRRLGVRFDVALGESFYHDRLAPLVDGLLARGIAVESEGAVCVFLPDQPAPMLIRKQDGAFLYATTDLATIQYRMERWNPAAILYVVDHRQSLHFQQLFATVRQAGLAPQSIELQHVSFGTVLGDDRRPFKTRSGDTVGLEGLLDEAIRRAGDVVNANDDAKPNGPELIPADRARIAEVVGIAALKYADLSQNRTSDYVFSYDKMLAMNGNTATYMQYAYARVRSIFAKGKIDAEALRAQAPAIALDTPAEQALALEILRFSDALDLVVADYRPNQLTSYLFELANRYSTFFEQCHVLRAETEALRDSRLMLCDLTARTIRQGLELLGIDVVEKM